MADNNADMQSYLVELKEYLIQRFKKQKNMIEHSRKLRHLQHEIRIPEEFQKTAQIYRTPIIKDITQRVTAQLTVNVPRWIRNPLGEGPKADALTGAIEEWQAAAHFMMEQQANRRTFRQGLSASIKDGMGVWGLAYRPDAWTPWPRRKKNEQDEETEDAKGYLARVDEFTKKRPFPFRWFDVDPLNYYYHDPDGLQEVMIIDKLPLKPAMKAFGVKREGKAWVKSDGKEYGTLLAGGQSFSGGDVECVTYCNANEYVYMLDDEIVDRRPHKWGKPPYVHFAGLSSHERTPEDEFTNVAFAFEHLVPLVDTLITMKMNWAYFGAFPRTVIKLTEDRLKQMVSLLPEKEQKAANVVDMVANSIGTTIVLYEGESADFMQVPNVGGDLNQMIQMTMQLIDAAGISNVLRGQMPTGDPNGYLYNQMTTMAQMAYDPVTDNAEFALRQQGANLLYGIDNIVKRDVPVWGTVRGEEGNDIKGWLKLGPKDIDGYYDIDVKLEPLLPSNYIMEGRFGLEQWKAGAIPWQYHVANFLHIPNPEKLQKQMLIEEFQNSEEMRNYRKMQTAKGLGLLPEEASSPGGGGPAALPAGVQGLGQAGIPEIPTNQMPSDPTMAMRVMPPAVPGEGIPGAGPTQMPGGPGGQQMVRPQ